MQARPSAWDWLEGFVWLVAPPMCPACDLPLAERPRADEALEPGASEASLKRAHDAPQDVFCAACAVLLEPPPAGLVPPAKAAAAYRYEGPLADAIRLFKYGGATHLARPLGALLARAAQAYSGAVDVVVPVPLHPKKLRQRGYNPAALLARPVATELGVPLRPAWLKRTRATRSQAGLTHDARQANVTAAFTAAPAPPARVLLIDDVRTTGATLAEAARSLLAQQHAVLTLTLAFASD